jgi:thymidylate kinase
MKILILEGCDNTGKTTLISNIIKKYNTKYNIVIKHCGKPLPNTPQSIFFTKEFYSIKDLIEIEKNNYKEFLLIYDRFIIGEYVWGSLYRHSDIDTIRNTIVNPTIININEIIDRNNIVQILLDASSEFVYNHDDGQSLGSTYNKDEFIMKIDKQREIFKKCLSDNYYNNLSDYYIYNVDCDNEFKSEKEIITDIIEILNKYNF